MVTGVNGFVGNHLVRELVGAGYEVIGVGGPVLATTVPEGLSDYIECDLTDGEAVKKLSFDGVAGVIHLAGLAAVGPSFDAPMDYISKNAAMEVHLFETALAQGKTPKFVVISSGSLYDTKAALPLTESSSVIPSSPYAVSKITQEQMGLYYSMRGFEFVIARPFNHIGPGQNIGFIVPDFASQIVAIERGEANEIKVGNLEAKRDFTDVRDIVRAYRLLLEKGRSGETYNVCSGKSISGQAILDALISLSRVDIPVAHEPERMRPSDTPDIYGSHDRLTKDTSWQPQISIEQTLSEVIDDWRSR